MGGYFQLCIAVTVALSSSYAPYFVVVDESGGPSRGRFWFWNLRVNFISWGSHRVLLYVDVA
jgi:hypothetical protein